MCCLDFKEIFESAPKRDYEPIYFEEPSITIITIKAE